MKGFFFFFVLFLLVNSSWSAVVDLLFGELDVLLLFLFLFVMMDSVLV